MQLRKPEIIFLQVLINSTVSEELTVIFPRVISLLNLKDSTGILINLNEPGTKIDYVSICSPNYLHDSHIRFALRHQADAICEKPIVLNPWNVDALQEIEKETGT